MLATVDGRLERLVLALAEPPDSLQPVQRGRGTHAEVVGQTNDGLQTQIGAMHQVEPGADAIERSHELGGEPVGLHLAGRAARGAEDVVLVVDRSAVTHLDMAELMRKGEALPGDCLRAVEEHEVPALLAALQAGDALGQAQDRHGNGCEVLDYLDDVGERSLETQTKCGARTTSRCVPKLLFVDDRHRPTASIWSIASMRSEHRATVSRATSSSAPPRIAKAGCSSNRRSSTRTPR